MIHLRDFADSEDRGIAYVEPFHLSGRLARVFKAFWSTLEESERFLQNCLTTERALLGIKRSATREPSIGCPAEAGCNSSWRQRHCKTVAGTDCASGSKCIRVEEASLGWGGRL